MCMRVCVCVCACVCVRVVCARGEERVVKPYFVLPNTLRGKPYAIGLVEKIPFIKRALYCYGMCGESMHVLQVKHALQSGVCECERQQGET